MKDAPQPVFETAMQRVIVAECVPLATSRGGEYADSWSLECMATTFVRSTLARFGVKLTKEEERLVVAAACVDLKDQRIASGAEWKRDNAVDGINYRALYTDLREQYERDHSPKKPPSSSFIDCGRCTP